MDLEGFFGIQNELKHFGSLENMRTWRNPSGSKVNHHGWKETFEWDRDPCKHPKNPKGSPKMDQLITIDGPIGFDGFQCHFWNAATSTNKETTTKKIPRNSLKSMKESLQILEMDWESPRSPEKSIEQLEMRWKSFGIPLKPSKKDWKSTRNPKRILQYHRESLRILTMDKRSLNNPIESLKNPCNQSRNPNNPKVSSNYP